jgi:hypothetical protein
VRSTSAAVRRQGIHFGGSLPSSAGIVGTDDARKAGPAGRHRRARRRLGATSERTSSACRLRRSGRPGWAHRLAPVGWQPEGQGSSPPGSTSRGNAAQGTCTASARSARSRAARHPASLACSVRDPVDIAPPFPSLTTAGVPGDNRGLWVSSPASSGTVWRCPAHCWSSWHEKVASAMASSVHARAATSFGVRG